MILEWAAVILPIAIVPIGYGVRRQLEVNTSVKVLAATVAERAKAQDEKMNHITGRVDAIYDHLITKS